MFFSLSLRAPARYLSLPVVGKVIEDLCRWLFSKGYPKEAIRRRVLGSPLLSKAIQRRGINSFRALTASDLKSLRPNPSYWTAQLTCALIQSLTLYLEERGALATAAPTPADELIAAHRRFLKDIRGLASRTVERECERVSQFLGFLRFNSRSSGVSDLDITEIDDFLGQASRRLGRASMQKLTSTLRSFIRFLVMEGMLAPGMDAHIDSPRCYRGERLPRALPWESVRSLLRVIDRSTPKGLRDYAMFLMIATYGLRVSEIAFLTLDDVSWRTRRLRVPRPKIGTPLHLPLTDEVATALLTYLRRGRASSTYRQMFLRVRAPIGPIKSTAVCDAFDVWASQACIQLPVGAGGPHCLRHSVAVHLLRQGSSLKTIGDLLGHRGAESTGVYLRLNIDDLRDVALAMPHASTSEVR